MKSIKALTSIIVLATFIMILTSCQAIPSPVEDFNWVLVQYGSLMNPKTPLPDTEITAFFDGKTKAVYGSSGCNTYKGTYTVDHLTLTINAPLSLTKIFCGGDKGIQESEFISQLQKSVSFEMDHGQLIIHSGDYRLKFNQTDKPVKSVTNWGE